MKRRDFIKNMTPMVVMPGLINGFSVKAYSSMPLLNALANATTTDNVLVLVQLKGGNDGLNTVIPLDQFSAYTNARANVAIRQSSVLTLSGITQTGLHPAMSGIRQRFDEGRIKIIQSVGYPSPSFSHFRATDIWLSASDANQTLNTGWAGRYLDYEYPNFPVGYPNTQMPDPLAIEIGSVLSLGFQGPLLNMAMSVTDPTDFYNMVNGVQDPVPNNAAGKELAYIRTIALQTNQYATNITQAANNVSQQSSSYPSAGVNALADQLKIVARLVAGGLKTRIYMVSLGGFDTHNSQVDAADTSTGDHAVLLGKVSEAINAFMDDLKFLSISNRVMGMTFSEFGRRILSNNSFGTDHGAAAPMFLFGDKVIPGILGSSPTIPANVTVNDNIPMQYDFRSVYASILEQWFCLKSADVQTVMLNNYQSLPISDSSTCITNIHDLNAAAGKSLISNYPNPFSDNTTISFETEGEHTSVEVFDTTGQRVALLTDKEYLPGTYTIPFNASSLPAGTYYARLQNQFIQQVKTMIKI